VTASVDAERPAELSRGLPWRLGRLQKYWPALRYCGAVYLVIRVALFLLSAAAWALTTEQASVSPNGSTPVLTNGWHNVITSWNKQDSLWFLQIAQHGYSSANDSAAFYPAYPIMIRLVGYLCLGHLLVAAYIVANGALLAALVVLYRLTERDYDTAMARRAVLYLSIFPTAFFLFDTYSEALFLLTAVGAIALARSRRWGWAGLVATVATLTRGIGIVVVLALAVEAIHQGIEDRRGDQAGAASDGGRLATLSYRLGASALGLVGIGAYLLYWQLRFHDWFRPIGIEKAAWGRVFSLPWATLWHGWVLAWRYGPDASAGWWMLDFAVVALGLVLAVWVALRTRPVYVAYTWGSLLFVLCTAWPERPLMSDPRFLIPVFPLAWALARLGQKHAAHDAIVAISAASMAIVCWLFLSTTLVF
jgi:Mannosyltransferase (PIG-V)